MTAFRSYLHRRADLKSGFAYHVTDINHVYKYLHHRSQSLQTRFCLLRKAPLPWSENYGVQWNDFQIYKYFLLVGSPWMLLRFLLLLRDGTPVKFKLPVKGANKILHNRSFWEELILGLT